MFKHNVNRSTVFMMTSTLCLLVTLVGCDSPDSVAKFCGSSETTLSLGKPVFQDFQASCSRALADQQPFDTFAVAAPDAAECQNIGKQVEGLVAVSTVLVNYFDALNKLASFNTGQVGADVKTLAAKATATIPLKADEANAISSLAGFITTVATSTYQRRQLANDVGKADADLQIVLAVLSRSITDDGFYLTMLANEEAKDRTRSKQFLNQYPENSSVILELNQRWQQDEQTLAQRRVAAQAYVAGLATIKKGHSELAANAKHLKAKELPGLLSPYCYQLQAVIVSMQKVI